MFQEEEYEEEAKATTARTTPVPHYFANADPAAQAASFSLLSSLGTKISEV